MVIVSSISGRSEPRTDRAVVSHASVRSSISATTASAVKLLEPLAMAKRVSTAFGMR